MFGKKICIHWLIGTKTSYKCQSAARNSRYIEPVREKILYTLAVLHENSYTLSHRWATMDARKVLKKVAP
jgi:hypothetical protein